MAWLPFACLIIAAIILTVLYSRTVGHIHRMVHLMDEALGVHERRLDLYGDSIAEMTEILGIISKHLEAGLEDGPLHLNKD